MKKRTKIIILILIVIVIIIAFIVPRSGNKQPDIKRSDKKGPQTLVVKSMVIKASNLDNNVSASGTILASEEVEIRSEVAGRITKIYFKEGSNVKAGQMLVKLNDSELRAQLSKNQSKLKLLQDRQYRQKALFEKEAISKEDYDATVNDLNMTKADIDLIMAQIEKTEIRAPFSGKIGIRNVSEGSYVTPTNLIANLQNTGMLKLDFSIPEKYYGQVKEGTEIKFNLSNSKDVYTAKVYAIEPKINLQTRTLQIRGIYKNTMNKIMPGSFVEVELVLEQIKNAIQIPTQTLVPEIKGQKVFLYRNGKVFEQKVETGIRTSDMVQITTGLQQGDTLLTSGILQLKGNAPVKLSEIK